jgi:hypothetical protein
MKNDNMTVAVKGRLEFLLYFIQMKVPASILERQCHGKKEIK